MVIETLIATGSDCAPKLAPKLAPWMRQLFQSPSAVARFLETHGSPVHVTVASEFRRNIATLLSAVRERGVSGGLFFARKANKLPWFVKLAKEEGIGVDTASLTELQETIDLGVSPAAIVVTAVGKSQELVSLAVASGCLVVVDNLDELRLVSAVAKSLGRQARLGLRFSGFKVKQRCVFSRFGFPIDDFRSLLLETAKESNLQLELLHAHLDRYDIEERALAARQLIEVADCAALDDQKVSAIDLGGGILIRYLESQSEWHTFLESLVESVAGDRASFTYQGDGFGLVKSGDRVLGKAELYPAWNDISKERFVGAILDYANGSPAVHKEIAERGLKLYFEPGRALLDNVGVTLARVMYRKRDTIGNLIVGVSMNRTNLRPFRAEFCVDPCFPVTENRANSQEGAFLVGSLCGEGDIIMRRKLKLNHIPEPNDPICFANTAGYLAHHLEVGTHGDPLPVNLLVDEKTFEILDASDIRR